jgi:flavorubredoxin
MRPLKIAEGIYDVGVKDWNLREFHGYATHQGTTYNSFLIIDEKVVLVDTVKNEFSKQHLENIAAVIDPDKIDFVISNHAEMDHSGALSYLMHVIGEDKPIYCSKLGAKNLSEHFSKKLNYQVVDDGAEINIGKRTLRFLETKMIHWPDSMFTYLVEDKILFSSDAFGQHYAGHENFDDEVSDDIFFHAKKYYANILLLFSKKIRKLIDHLTGLGIEIDMICPDHGIVWRQRPADIIEKYISWTSQQPIKKVVVLYDTMWKSTEKMAESIVSGISSTGVQVIPMHLRKWHRSDVMTEVMDASAVIVGSPTLNNGIYPTLSDVLTYIKGLKPQNKIGAAFGSFGWSGEAVKILNSELESMGIDLVDPGLRVKYVPDNEHLKECKDFGVRIGNIVNERFK